MGAPDGYVDGADTLNWSMLPDHAMRWPPRTPTTRYRMRYLAAVESAATPDVSWLPELV
jgi:hypothetical protein